MVGLARRIVVCDVFDKKRVVYGVILGDDGYYVWLRDGRKCVWLIYFVSRVEVMFGSHKKW